MLYIDPLAEELASVSFQSERVWRSKSSLPSYCGNVDYYNHHREQHAKSLQSLSGICCVVQLSYGCVYGPKGNDTGV